jgi:hypothetical protein
MRNFPLLCSLMIMALPTAGQQVTRDYPRLLWDEDFNQSSEKWPLTYNADNFFVIQNGNFELLRSNQKTGTFVFSRDERNFNFFEAKTRIVFNEGSAKMPVAGLVLQAQPDGSGALVVEINNKGQYRVRRVRSEQSIYLTGNGEHEGWMKPKKVLNRTDNIITVKTYEKVYDVYLNGQYASTFTELEFSSGKMGFYVGPGTRISTDYLQVRGDDNFTIAGGGGSEIQEENLTFQQIIVKLKETINKKDRRIAELEAEVRRLGSARGGMGIDTISARRAQELERLNADLIREIERLRMETSAQQARIQELEFFRNQIREGENGDILINLTNVNLRLKQQVDKLETLRKVLETENSDLRNENLRLQQENDRMRAQLSNQETEMRYLRQRLVEKDSLLMDCNNRKSNSGEPEPEDSKHGKDEQEPVRETPGGNQPGISADEIRRLQEQERQQQSEDHQKGRAADKPEKSEKPEKTKRKGSIPPPIIID